MNKNKTRNLSAAEYFHQVQREYLIAEFRRKIYYKPKDKRYYERVMGWKKEKIQDIANRNRLDSIFTSDAKMEEIRAELFDVYGKPIFEISVTDELNYYSKGNEFSYNGDIWVLDYVNSDGTLVLYSKSLEAYETVSKSCVSRIM